MAMHFRTGRPERAVVQLAKEIGADVIVVATHETTRWQRLLGGSTADRSPAALPAPSWWCGPRPTPPTPASPSTTPVTPALHAG